MGWYKTGSISVSGVTVTGVGTNWTDNKQGIGPGQALLLPAAGTVKMYEILRVDSATKLTLTSDAGTVAAGQAYAIMSFYTDSIPDFARRLSAQLSYYQSQMDGWQQIMTGTGSITIAAPDGTNVTISSFKKLTDDVAAKLDKNQNLNDLPNKSTARTNLGLGSSAIRDVGSDSNNVMPVGAFGLGSNTTTAATGSNANNLTFNGFSAGGGSSGINFADAFAPILSMARSGGGDGTGQLAHLQISSNLMAFRYRNLNNWTTWTTVYHTGNTTKASDGTLKAASPIVQVYTDGSCHLNDESEGCTVTRLSVGEYFIEGCTGLNADAAWGGIDGGFDIPTDRNKQPLIWLDYEVNADGSVLVKTYHRTNPGAPEFARNEIDGLADGDPVDIPTDQFVSVRVQMPACSIWNQKQEEAIDAMRKFESEEPTDPQQG